MIFHMCHSQCFNEELQVFGGCQNSCLWVRNRLASLETYEPFSNNVCKTKDSAGKYVCSYTYWDIKLQEKKTNHGTHTHLYALKMAL